MKRFLDQVDRANLKILLSDQGSLLRQYKPWVINTEENFGFMIDKHGVKGEGQFTGEFGTSWVNYIPPEGVQEISRASELLIPNSINLKNLIDVVFKDSDVLNKV